MRGIDTFLRRGRIHLIAIGGAGMSAIANVLLDAGAEVSGSDLASSPASERLRERGAAIHVGHSASNVEGAGAVIYSVAVPSDNEELLAAREMGIPALVRGEALARIVDGYRTVAITGTHGKTTTSAMVATVLTHAGWDPTFLVGGEVKGLPGAGGGHLGAGAVAVVEADEAYGSFLHLRPAVAVVLNADVDHLDHYGDPQSLHRAFSDFTSSAAEAAVVCADHAVAMQVAQHAERVLYGTGEQAQVRADQIVLSHEGAEFRLVQGGRALGRVKMRTWGMHNVTNATGAAAASLTIGVDPEAVVEGLSAFAGVSRRFEMRGSIDGVALADDYAHLPAEIDAVLAAARTGPWRRIIGVFQPHLYSRTRELSREFAFSLARGCDVAVVTDVFGSREKHDPGVTGKLVSDAICEVAPGKPVAYLPRLQDVPPYIRRVALPGDLVLTIGAGDITKVPSWLAEEV